MNRSVLYNIAVFASGSGSNAENMVNHFNLRSDNSNTAKISVILSNKKDAYVLQRAARLGVPAETFSYSDFQKEEVMLPLLEKYHINFIVLAGFLLKVPPFLIDKFQHRILNIHPALLPNYGGKGMYGEKVHQAVIAAGEKESGITVHVIDQNYDQGLTIYQAKCPITKEDTPETLAAKIHELERAYPEVTEKYIELYLPTINNNY